MLYTAAESRRREAALTRKEALTLTQLIADREEVVIESARQVLVALAQVPVVRQGDIAACNEVFAWLMGQVMYPVALCPLPHWLMSAIEPGFNRLCRAVILSSASIKLGE
jgi:hypothetical protein